MKFKFTWGRKLIAGILLAAVVVGGTAAPAEAAGKKSTAVVAQDNYRKTLCKGFLGKSYGSVVDGIRCDCSGYTRAALNRLESKGRKGTALKNVSVGAHCTRDWVSGSGLQQRVRFSGIPAQRSLLEEKAVGKAFPSWNLEMLLFMARAVLPLI